MKYIVLSLLFCPVLCIGQEVLNLSLDQAIALLPPHTTGYFATIDGDKPDLRGWQFQAYEKGNFIFCTSNQKSVFKQIQKNANVAFACAAGEYHFRINGKVTIVSPAEKKRLFQKLSESVQKLYKSWDNDNLVIFTVSGGNLRVAKGFAPYQSIKY
ncbi:MAG: pyridoxamine 5'-phosphate oxidase family protein [Prevotellaceae bacterium]|jgi:uncharacterized pyridoxamine 5'-phosphate oxidase family protein|nr:pyridoxamine 5'-phosphate oxidase family protein [Prevotellaceae bacterium]